MRQYREIATDAELELALAACECDGFDRVQQFRKAQRLSSEYAACLCGARRGRRKPQGGWSVVIDSGCHATIAIQKYCMKLMQDEHNGTDSFSITGQPDR